MPIQRKVFRIEEMAGHPAATARGVSASERTEILAELKALHELVAQRTGLAKADLSGVDASDLCRLRDDTDAIQFALERTKQEIAALHATALGGPSPARMTRQLDAIAEIGERATMQILDSAEAIEDAANTLSASVKREQEHALTHDIQDQVLRIFEACNFQDLSGQRIVKVLATLKFIEERIAHMVDVWGGIETFRDYYAAIAKAERDPSLKLHGPKLDGDEGHATQAHVDAMFARAG